MDKKASMASAYTISPAIMPKSMPNLAGVAGFDRAFQDLVHGGPAAAQVRTVNDIVMDQHEVMQEFHTGGGIIQFTGNFFGGGRVAFIGQDQKQGPQPFAFPQGKFTDTFKQYRRN